VATCAAAGVGARTASLSRFIGNASGLGEKRRERFMQPPWCGRHGADGRRLARW